MSSTRSSRPRRTRGRRARGGLGRRRRPGPGSSRRGSASPFGAHATSTAPPIEVVVGGVDTTKVVCGLRSAPGGQAQVLVQVDVPDDPIHAVRHDRGIPRRDDQAARPPGPGVRTHDPILHHGAHGPDVGAHSGNAGPHGLQGHDGQSLVVGRQEEEVELGEPLADLDRAADGDGVLQAELGDALPAALVVLGHVLGRTAYVQVDRAAPLAQDPYRLDEIHESFDGDHAGDVSEPPQVVARALGADPPGLLAPGRESGVELLDGDPVGDDDGLGGVSAQRPGLLDGGRVEVGGGIGARIAHAPHLQPPGHPHALTRRDVEEPVVRQRDDLVHPAVQERVDGIAHVEIVLGEQVGGAMLTGRVGGQKRGVAGGVSVVDGGSRHGFGQHRIGEGEEVAQ